MSQPSVPTSPSAPVVSVVTGSSAPYASSFGTLYVHVETPPERYERLANERADAAVRFGMSGYQVTAELCAELADAYADRARIARALDEQNQTTIRFP